MKISESNLTAEMFKSLNDQALNWKEGVTEPFFAGVIGGFVNYLSSHKTSEKPQAIVVTDDSKKVLFTIFCERQENGEAKSYSLGMSFDENDIPENAEQHLFTDEDVRKEVVVELGYKYGIQFNSPLASDVDYMKTLVKTMFVDLLKVARANVETDPVLEFKDWFRVDSHVEDGKLVATISPSEIIKQQIKDDKSVATAETPAA